MYAVSLIYLNWSTHCFPFSSFQGKFFLSKNTMDFFAVTAVDDCLLHRTYWFTYHPQVWPRVWIAVTIGNSILSLRIFTIWLVTGWKRYMSRLPWMRMKNGPPFIINCLSPGGGLRGGVFQKCSNIYTPHLKTSPYQGMLKRYFP